MQVNDLLKHSASCMDGEQVEKSQLQCRQPEDAQPDLTELSTITDVDERHIPQ